jgi:hypothetical protein
VSAISAGDPGGRSRDALAFAQSYRGRILRMASQKRSISFEESVLNEAEQRLAQSGGSLSAFVNAAVLHELQIARGRELLAADEAELGAIPGNVKTQVAAEWPA